MMLSDLNIMMGDAEDLGPSRRVVGGRVGWVMLGETICRNTMPKTDSTHEIRISVPGFSVFA